MDIEAEVKKIEQSPHWRVLIRPSKYKEVKNPKVGELQRAVSSHAVSIRGWTFPQVPRSAEDQECGPNYFGGITLWSSEAEYFRYFSSGQFLFLSRVKEFGDASWHKMLEELAAGHGWRDGKPREKPNGYFSLINLLYHFCEYVEFATRLAGSGLLGESADLTISLNQIRGFVLTTEHNRSWWNPPPFAGDKVEFTDTFDAKTLIAESKEIILQIAEHFFKNLGWNEFNHEVIKKERDKFFRKEFS